MRTPKPCLLPGRPTSVATLRASGISRQMIRTAVESGRLLRLRQGVYLDAAHWPIDPREQHLLRAAAEVELYPSAVLSHQSAGSAWNLPAPGFTDWHDHPPCVLLPPGVRKSSTGGPVTYRVGRLPAGQVILDDAGHPVTSIARTAVDLAAGRPLPEALAILDAAARQLCQGMVARIRRSDYANPRLVRTTRALLEEASWTRRPAGLPAMIQLADPCRESVAESLSAGHFHLAGLPAALHQEPLGPAGGRFFPDFYWRHANLIGECDGAVKYADARGYVQEKEREQRLRDHGFRVVRWLAKEIIVSPEVVVARVARALEGYQRLPR